MYTQKTKQWMLWTYTFFLRIWEFVILGTVFAEKPWPWVRPSQCLVDRLSLHPHTQTLDSSYSCPPQSFRWLIRSLIYPLSDITVSLQPPPPPLHTLLTGLGEELEVEVAEGELARRLRLSETTETPSVRALAMATLEENANMDDLLLDQGLGMEETDHRLLRRPSLKETYHCDSLLAPDTDFLTGRASHPQPLTSKGLA